MSLLQSAWRSLPENIWLFTAEWLHIMGDITWDSPESPVQWLQCAWVIKVPPCWLSHTTNPGLASVSQPQGAANNIWLEQERTWIRSSKDETANSLNMISPQWTTRVLYSPVYDTGMLYEMWFNRIHTVPQQHRGVRDPCLSITPAGLSILPFEFWHI